MSPYGRYVNPRAAAGRRAKASKPGWTVGTTAARSWSQGTKTSIPLLHGSPDVVFEQLRQDWNEAYHEGLRWQQRVRFPRGQVEAEFERQLQDKMMRELSLNPRLDEAGLSAQIESFSENWLMTPRGGIIPLVAIYMEQPREDPWMEEIYRSEINGWYVKAAQYFDQGIKEQGTSVPGCRPADRDGVSVRKSASWHFSACKLTISSSYCRLTNSTLRFCWRPSSVALSATG